LQQLPGFQNAYRRRFVASHIHRDPAGFIQQGVPIAQAHERAVNPADHFQDPFHASEAVLLLLTFCHVSTRSAKSDNAAARIEQCENVGLKPAVMPVLARERHEKASGSTM